MFAQRSRLKLLGLGLITTGLMACQGQQQQQQQQSEPGKPINFNAGGFEGLESGQLALLAASCNPATDPVVITVASGEFAYLYRRTDGNVVVNTANQCTFAATKRISIVAAENSGNQGHKVLIDYLSGTFSMGVSGTPGIDIDLKTTGVNQVMFRGTINPDVFSLGTASGTSYLGFATGGSTPVTAPTFANVSLLNVSDVTITAGPGDDIISGQGASTGMTSPASLLALDGAISLTVHGGDGADQITSGAVSSGTAQNSLNGNNGSDVFHQPSALGSDVVSGGTDPTLTLTLVGTATGTNSAVVVVTGTTTATATASGSGTATLTNSQTATATATRTVTTTATATASASITKATSVNTTATATVTSTQTASQTATWTGVYLTIGTDGAATTATRSYTGTLSNTGTISATLTLTATGTTVGAVTVTGSKTGTATNTLALTGLATQTYTSLAVSLTNTSVQTDLSVDVVDYSQRTLPVKVTLGDQTSAVAASATVVLPNSGAIRSYDSFEITDGELTDTDVSTSYTTRVVEFHRAGTYADGTLEVPANGASDLANDDTFTIDDGSHAVTFHVLIGAGTNTLTGTATSLNIHVGATDDRPTVAAAIVAGINTYQTATWTGVATGTATMTSTSIVPNVTVTAPDSGNNDIVAMQNRNTGSPTLLAEAGALTVTNNTSSALRNANGAETIAVDFDDSTPIAATAMATAVQAAIAGDASIAVTATVAGTVVTITANNPIAVKPHFGVTLKSGGFAITVVSNGTPAAGPGANDGDIAGSGEKDSILNDVENVIGGSGADTIDATHSTNIAHRLFGMAGADTLIIGTLSSGGDMLYGGPGDDHLIGGGGVQTMYGGDGNDFMAGGLGNDIIDGDGANCVVASTGVYASSICDATFAAASSTAGSNYLDYSDRTAPVTVTISATMSGTGRAAQIGVSGERDDVTNCTNLRGGSGADTLTGSTGDNIIYGGPGDDTINGGGGNDSLYGDEGDDTISGDAGDDYIYGGSGVNSLYGDASGYAGTAGINMLDNSQGRMGAVACGAGDMDILFSDGEETGTNTCELK